METTSLRVDLLTREYPPEVYGGAGVHLEYLARDLRRLADVRVHCFGAPRDEPGVTAYADPPGLSGANAALRTMGVDLEMAAGCAGTDVVHSHTWYANLAGHVAKLLYGVPHVVTTHSLEPLRPWKAEQLGGGYALSSWVERTAIEAADAVVAVSAGMRRDVLAAYPGVDPDNVRVVHNGIDTEQYAPDRGTDVLARLGVDPGRPTAIFVGRITRQKGLPYLLRAAAALPADAQLVFLAGAPDTKEIAAEVEGLVDGLRATHTGIVWVPEMLPKHEVIQLLTHATVFVCPSIYEPMGIVNLEAMACETAVVATATGGIPEVVDDGVTGLLVPIEQASDGTGTPLDPDRFVADLAAALNTLLADPARARHDGPGRAPAGDRPLLVGVDRRADDGGLPRGPALAQDLDQQHPGVGEAAGQRGDRRRHDPVEAAAGPREQRGAGGDHRGEHDAVDDDPERPAPPRDVRVAPGALVLPDQDDPDDRGHAQQFGADRPASLVGHEQEDGHHQRRGEQDEGLQRPGRQSGGADDLPDVDRDGDEQQAGEGGERAAEHDREVGPALDLVPRHDRDRPTAGGRWGRVRRPHR